MNTVIVNDQPDWMHSLPGYKNEAKLNSKLRRKVKRSVKKSFDPSQPRDSAGRWTATGEDALIKQIPDGIRADVLKAYRREIGGGRFEITGVIPDKRGGVELQYSSWATPGVERKSEIVNADIGFPRERRFVEDTSIGDDYSPDIPESFAALASDSTFYRGMSDEELRGIFDTGIIQSKGEMNLTEFQAGRTYFTPHVRAARDYAASAAPARFRPTFDKPGYVIAVRGQRGENGWEYDPHADAWGKMSEYGKRGGTSADDIIGVMEVRLKREYPGEMSFNDDGRRSSSSPPNQSYVYRDVSEWYVTSKSNPNHDDRGRFAVASNPVKPGSTPIPAGHIRLYHYTEAPPDTIRKEGLRLDQAKGSTYGEPNYVWASSNNPGSHKTVVEFHVPADDTAGRLEMPDKKSQTDLDAWHANGIHHVGFERDIKPEEIIAVHEPWHDKYRHIVDNPGLMADVLAGKHDRLLTPKYPEDQPYVDAVAYAKKRHLGKAFNPNEPRDWQGKWTRVGTIPGLVDWVKGQYKEKGEWSGHWTERKQREAVNESLNNFNKALNEHFSDAVITDVVYLDNAYEPTMGFKYHYRPTPTVVERTEPDEWGGPPHKVWADTALDNNPDYTNERTPMPTMEALKGKPGVAFRGISNEEMRNIIRTGRVRSDSSRNFSDQKGRTLMADKPHSAYSYAAGFAVEGDRPRFGKPGYLLAIDVSEQPHELNSVLEIDVSGDIPAEKILAVEEIALHIQEEGKHFYRLDGTHFSGEDAGTSYKQRDVTQEVKSKIEQRAAARRADEHRKRVRASVRS